MDAHALRVLEFHRVKELLAARCSSPLGKRVAAELEPYDDASILKEALGQTDEARAVYDRGDRLPIDGITDIADLIRKAHDEKHAIEPAGFLEISKTLRRASELRAWVRERSTDLSCLERLAAKFLDHAETIHAIESTIESPGQVADRASERLWEIRRAIATVEDEVRERLGSLLTNPRIRDAVQHTGWSIRGGRFVLPVKLDMKGHVPGILHDHSRAGSTAFIEPSEIVPLTNRLRELRADQTTEEGRILWNLTRQIFARMNAVKHTTNLLAWFEFTAAKAQFSKEFDMRAPELAEDGRMRLVEARHPLLLRAAAEARDGRRIVPVDMRLREGFRILVITGPNTGGKTVTLKTVGLLQAMFQSGMHVPVSAGSRMPMFKDIFADIGDEQSIDQNLSTFSGHVRNIAQILDAAGKGTLVLLDELGAGTDPAEGAALATAILDELRDRRCAVIVTTHIGSLKQYAYSNPEVENACVEFDLETFSPTYRLLIGQPGNSNALHIARKWGVSEPILERARLLVDSNAERTQEFIDQLQKSREAVESVRQQSEAHLVRSKNLQKAAEERMRHLEKRERRTEQEAENLIDDVLKAIAEQTAGPLRELRNVPAALKPAVENVERVLRDAIRNSSLGRKRREFIASLAKEDRVYVPKFGQICRVRKINKQDETLTLVVGNLNVEVPFDDVSWLTPAPEAK